MKNFSYIILFYILVGSLGSCYYDIEEELYPAYATNLCDTSNLSYSKDIEPLLSRACYNCHGAGVDLGNVTLEGYSSLETYINDGSLIGSIKQSGGFSSMPKGGTKFNECSTNKVAVWIRQGALNN